MEKLSIELGQNSYDILFSVNGLQELGALLVDLHKTKKCCLISQKAIFKYHGIPAYNSLKKAGYEVNVYLLPAGEEAKSNEECIKLYKFLLANSFDRDSVIVALGGGVVGDLSGFVASTYMRGLAYVQVPTTLLAAVDSSVGGKTAINFCGIKNVIGTFYQPKLVFVDTQTHLTLPTDEFRAGFAEVIKYAILDGEPFLALLEKQLPHIEPMSAQMQEIIKKCCQIKSQIVELDEKETTGARMLLNLGHTMGHAVEVSSGLKHGEAVAIGIVFASRYANYLGLLPKQEMERIINLIKKAQLPWEIPADLSMSLLKELIAKDKKASIKQIKWILPYRIGDVRIHPESLTKIPKF